MAGTDKSYSGASRIVFVQWLLLAILMGSPLFALASDAGLQAMEQRLVERYQALHSRLPETAAAMLAAGQQQWQNGSARACRSGTEMTPCLRAGYQRRDDELALGVVSLRVDAEQLPQRIELPVLGAGELRLVQEASRRAKAEGGAPSRLLVLENAGGVHELWRGRIDSDPEYLSESDTLDYLEFTLLHDDQLVVMVQFDTAIPAESIQHQRRYLAYVPGQGFVVQGTVRVAGQGEAWDNPDVQWLAGDEGIVLKEDYFPGFTNPDNLLGPAYETYRLYRLRFDGLSWQKVPTVPQRWLQGAEHGVGEFVALYQAIALDIGEGVRDWEIHYEGCDVADIDWELASRGLGVWLDIAVAAQQRGVGYSDAPAIFAALLASGERPPMNESQRELLRALDHYRRQLETLPDWRGFLVSAQRFNSGQTGAFDWGHVGESMEEPVHVADYLPAIHCREWIIAPQDNGYWQNYIDLHSWLLSFWARRYADGSYDIAREVVAAGVAIAASE